MVDKLGMDENEPIESKMVTKAVESAQKRVEGNNYDMRKNYWNMMMSSVVNVKSFMDNVKIF